jgi:hypothetical protein
MNDVFISYKRGRINEQWMNEIFLPFFEDYLNNLLPNPPVIFIDKKGLTPGVDFENELFRNLIYSKCLVSIWSPPYFRRSEWCIKEFLSMRYQQEVNIKNGFTLPQTLLWPVLYRKVEPLPDAVSKLTYLDYSEFNVVGEAFFKNEMSLRFQQKLQEDITSISEIILNAPPLDPALETEEGQKQRIDQLKAYYDTYCDFYHPPQQKPITWLAQ